MKDYGWLILGIGVVALVVMLMRRNTAGATYQPMTYLPVEEGHRYVNKEVMEIEWNADCLPVKITTHRDARQT